jgi:hypothetical protein
VRDRARRATRGVPVRRPSHRFPQCRRPALNRPALRRCSRASDALLAPAMLRRWIVRIGPALG